MSLLLVICACCMELALAWTPTHLGPPYALEDAEIYFEGFLQEYNKQYADENEKQVRFQIFKDNLEKANRMNEGRNSTVYGVTQFMDLEIEEFRILYTGLKPGVSDEDCTYITDADIHDKDAPDSLDWRESNIVSPVKNQKSCGSCYSFSSTGNIESQYAMKYKKMITISEQQIVDCDKRNGGCQGGTMTAVFRSLIEEGGSESEEDYPYKGEEGECQFDADKVKVKLADCHGYNLTSQEKLKQLLHQNGPISIAVRSDALMQYGGGVISENDCFAGKLDHGALLVGYGTENGDPYWIVKNSWGEPWGEHGYYRMHRGDDADSCGMMNDYMASAIVA